MEVRCVGEIGVGGGAEGMDSVSSFSGLPVKVWRRDLSSFPA